MFTLTYREHTIRVYEPSDSEELFAELVKVKDTYQKENRRGKNKGKFYSYPCSFDIETSTIISGQFDYTGDTPVGFPYLFQFNIFGYVFMCRTYEECVHFFNRLSWDLHTDKVGLYIFVHNLSYEYQFLKDLWDIKKIFALDAHKPVTISLNNGIVFRDSWKLTNMSLELFAKNWCKVWQKEKEIMDYDLLRTPYSELDENTLLYSALDVLCLSEAVENYLNAHNTDVFRTAVTATGFTRKKVRKSCCPSVRKTPEEKRYARVLEKTKLDPDTYWLLKRESKGGNTHANVRYMKKLLKDLVHFDICSSYPTQMVCYPEYPIAEWIYKGNYETGVEIEDIIELEKNGFCTLCEMMFENLRLKEGVQCPCLSISKLTPLVDHCDDKWEKVMNNSEEYLGRYVGGYTFCSTAVFGIEFTKLISKYYEWDDVVIGCCYYAVKGYLPTILREQILEFFKLKTELKGVADREAEYAIGKANLNSIYGSCYTDPIRETYEYNGKELIAVQETRSVEEVLEEVNKKATYFAPYSWGAMTAVLGQVFLYKMIDAVGEDFVYCDTDSVFALNPDKSRKAIKDLEKKLNKFHKACGLEITAYDIKGKPHTLGTIDEEEPLKEFKTLGSKKYAMLTIDDEFSITIAGVPKKSGAKCLKCVDDLRTGVVFDGETTGKLTHTYNEVDEPFTIHDENGNEIKIYSNIGLTKCDYLLGVGKSTELFMFTHGLNDPDLSYTYVQETMV